MDANDRRHPASVTRKPVAGNAYAACVIVLGQSGKSGTCVASMDSCWQQLVHEPLIDKKKWNAAQRASDKNKALMQKVADDWDAVIEFVNSGKR